MHLWLCKQIVYVESVGLASVSFVTSSLPHKTYFAYKKSNETSKSCTIVICLDHNNHSVLALVFIVICMHIAFYLSIGGYKSPDPIRKICCCFLLDQSFLTLCDPMDCSPPGSSLHGILQAKMLEYVAMPSSRGSSTPGIEPRFPALRADSLPSEPLGEYIWCIIWN